MKLNKEKFNLAKARTCKGTKELEAAGIPRGTLCTAISGKNVRPETIGKIAKALGVDVTEIID
nr:MAG TPA_asm: SOS-response transcriptional repressor [Caudoviricetes sp.]